MLLKSSKYKKILSIFFINLLLLLFYFIIDKHQSFDCVNYGEKKMYKINNSYVFFNCAHYELIKFKISQSLSSGYKPLTSLRELQNEDNYQSLNKYNCQAYTDDTISCRLSNTENIKVFPKENKAIVFARISNDLNSASMKELHSLGIITDDMNHIYTEFTEIAYYAYVDELKKYPEFNGLIYIKGNSLIFNILPANK